VRLGRNVAACITDFHHCLYYDLIVLFGICKYNIWHDPPLCEIILASYSLLTNFSNQLCRLALAFYTTHVTADIDTSHLSQLSASTVF